MAVASIPVDWNLAQQPEPLDYMPSALEGAQAGQQLRGISALQGIDLNNPDSLNKGIGNLVRAGAADQANALIGLQINRSALQNLPTFWNRVQALGGQSSAAPQPQGQPQAQAASDQSQAQTGQADPQHVQQTMTMAKGAADSLLAMPQDQRAAALPAIKQQLLERGVPEAAIDSATQDLSDGALQGLSQHYGQVLTGLQAGPQAAGATPAAMTPHASTYAWTQNLLSDPGLMAQMDFYKKYGIDFSSLIGQAQAIAAPSISKAAEIQAAPELGSIAAETARKTAAATLPYEIAKAGGSAAAAAAATAPYTKVELPSPSGAPQVVSGAQFAARGQAAGPQGTIAQGPGIGQATDLAAQATALNTYNDAATTRLAQAPQNIAKGEALLGIANAVNTGKYTESLSQAAQYLPATHSIQQYATNSSLLAQDLKGTFQQALNGMAVPRVAVEAKSILGGIPTSSSPQDQVKVYAAGLLAATQYNQAHDRFIQQWTADQSKPRSLAAADAAWQQGPGAQSLFAMPAWQGVQIGGKPAVDTHEFKGKSYLIVLPGLLGQHALVLPQ